MSEVKKVFTVTTKAGVVHKVQIKETPTGGFGEIDWDDSESCHICGRGGVPLAECYLEPDETAMMCNGCVESQHYSPCIVCKIMNSTDKVCPDEKCQGYIIRANMATAFKVGGPMRHFITGAYIREHGYPLPESEASAMELAFKVSGTLTKHYIGQPDIGIGRAMLFHACFESVVKSKHVALVLWTGNQPVVEDKKKFQGMFNTALRLLDNHEHTGIAKLSTTCWMMDQLISLGLKENVQGILRESFINYVTKSDFTDDETIYAAVEMVNMCRILAADCYARCN